MARLTALPEEAIISGFKGTLDYYVWKGLPVVRAWPSSPGKRRSASVEAQWPVFADAMRLWTSLSSEVQDAYRAMATGSTMSGRDMFSKTYINGIKILPY